MLPTMTKSFFSDRFQWGIMASLGLIIPAIILFSRLRLACPTLELHPLAFLPLAGIVNGRDPHLLIRIMHDLTHPVFLLGYAFALTYVAARSVDRPLNEKSSQFLGCGLLLFHLSWLVTYFITMFLPIGDMISEVSTQ